MRFHAVLRVSQSKGRAPLLFQSSRPFSQSQSKPKRPSFGIAFDIDGVILRGRVPIGGSPQTLRKLCGDSISGALSIPFVFLTNGGGIPESRRAIDLTEVLGVHILPSQVIQGHSPFKNLMKRFENELIIAVGKGEPALVMSEYGFKKVLSLDEYASYFKDIDPVSQYKTWTTMRVLSKNNNSKEFTPRYNVFNEGVKAAFVVSDPVDWGRDIQVLCDILRSGGIPGQGNGHQPPLYFAADDLEYQAAFPSKRLGMGAFRIALENIFNGNAETILRQLQSSYYDDHFVEDGATGTQNFETLYMIGDNPFVDIKGARQAGHPWFSILTRTGVFRGEDNHAEFPADLVVDTVEEAVDYILKKECIS